ncbi:hypothetical protein P9112_008143 [Eukaryota sp. TZLM1-RC]
MTSQSEKKAAIDSWLYSLGESATYEDDTLVIDFLYDLFRVCSFTTDTANIISQAAELETSHLTKQSEQLNKFLAPLELTPSHLSSKARSALSSLSNAADALNLSDVSPDAFIHAAASLEMDLITTESDLSQHKQRLGRILDITVNNEVLAKYNTTAKVDDYIAQVLQNNLQISENYALKEAEYTHSTNEIKKELKKLPLTHEITHSALVGLKQKLNETEESLVKHSKRLESFKGLPADEALATERVEELRREVRGLQDKLGAEVAGLV